MSIKSRLLLFLASQLEDLASLQIDVLQLWLRALLSKIWFSILTKISRYLDRTPNTHLTLVRFVNMNNSTV